MRCGNLLLVLGALGTIGCGSDSPSGPNGGKPGGSSVSPENALVAGSHFTCALTADGAAYCWGANNFGQLGTGSTMPTSTPALVAGPGTYREIGGSEAAVCALRLDGFVDCWGMLPGAVSSATNASRPVRQDTPKLASIGVGFGYACGLDDVGSAWCWGVNNSYQLGLGDQAARTSATKIPGELSFKHLSVGFWHACGLTDTGAVYCWGDNGRLEARGTPGPAMVPTLADFSLSFVSINAGGPATCGVTNAGGYCWGSNYTAQRGSLVGLGSYSTAPGPIESNVSFTSIRMSDGNDIGGHTCATTASGDLYCWGLDDSLQTGTPGSASCQYSGKVTPCVPTPVKVAGISNVTAVATGLRHSCALKADHTMFCWGANSSGELGDGTRTQRGTPVKVGGDLIFP